MRSVFDDIDTPEGTTRSMSRAEVRARGARLVPKAFRTLERNLSCGSAKEEIAAAIGVLDRFGYGPQSKITVEDEREDLSMLTDAQLLARIEQLKEHIGNGTRVEPVEDGDVGPFGPN
jgi:hypothetical protein